MLALARRRLAAGDATAALSLLKTQALASPESTAIRLLLGVAYLEAGNDLWAIRTLARVLAERPGDCQARAWLAWAFLRQAALDDAALVLDAGDQCMAAQGATAAAGTRLLLLRAFLARQRARADGGPTAAGRTVAAGAGPSQAAASVAAILAQLRRRPAIFAADRPALAELRRQVLPGALPELSWRLEAGLGYTSNAWMGSPTDEAARGIDGQTAMLQADLWLRLAPDFDLPLGLRPVGEVGTKLSRYLTCPATQLSYLELSGRVGLSLGRSYPRLFLGYRPDFLLLDQGDRYDAGPVWYFGAHRGELEVEATPWLTVFAGGGRRVFRDLARSRTEVDGGLGGRVDIGRRLTLLWAASARGYVGNNAAYNLVGGSMVLSGQLRLPRGLWARIGLTAAIDWYLDSAGYFDPTSERARRDVLLKPGVGLWSPAWHDARLGVTYDFSNRDSTAGPYAFSDHRVLLKIAWHGEVELSGPRVTRTPASATAEWFPWASRGSAPGAATGDEPDSERPLEERVQDLLRQDEQVQRASSCAQ